MTTAFVEGKPYPAVPEKVQVELDIFSGKPNPTWILGDADTVVLAERVATMPEAEARTWSAPLGYRGFVVQTMQAGRPTQLRVQKGTLEVSQDGKGASYYRDTNRRLERWLLETGKASLDAKLLSLVEDEWDR